MEGSLYAGINLIKTEMWRNGFPDRERHSISIKINNAQRRLLDGRGRVTALFLSGQIGGVHGRDLMM